MRISVVIVTKNRKDYLLRAIESVVNQTRVADEIIVVDDASNYDIESTIKSLNIKKIKLIINTESLGGAVARNIGARASSCDVLMFLDDDDAWEKNKIEKQVPFFLDNEDVVVVYSGRKIVRDDDLNKILRTSVSKKEGDLSNIIFEKNYVGITSSVAMKKEVFDKVGGFDENLPCRQDYDLWIRMTKNGHVIWDKEYSVIYTLFVNPLKQISGRSDKHEFAANYILNKYSNELSELPFFLRRKSIAEKYFSVQKAYRRNSYVKSIQYGVKSFFNYPSVKPLVLLLPSNILKKIGL